jgi:hypothetical protein
MIKALLRRWKLAIAWDQALDLAAHHKFVEALKKISLIEDIGKDLSKQTEFSVRMRILKAVILFNLKRWQEALNVIEHLQPILTKKGIGPQSKYLAGYVSWLAREIIDQSGKKEFETRLRPILTFDLHEIDLNKVPAHLKRKFPLRLYREGLH